MEYAVRKNVHISGAECANHASSILDHHSTRMIQDAYDYVLEMNYNSRDTGITTAEVYQMLLEFKESEQEDKPIGSLSSYSGAIKVLQQVFGF